MARYVAARRKALERSQDALAKDAGVDSKTIWNLEAGRWPIAKNRRKIEPALGWAEGDFERIFEGGFPVTGPLPEDDPDGMMAAAGEDFDGEARAMIARLPEPERSVMETIYQSWVDTQRQNQVLLAKLVTIRRRRPGDDRDDDGGACGVDATEDTS